MGEANAAPGLPTLLTWFSPAFPIGAFAHSHGLEAAVAEGWVRDGAALVAWIRTLLQEGSGWNDLVLLAEGMRLAAGVDTAGLADLDELAIALSGSAERRAETLALGTAFSVASAAWCDDEDAAASAYPVAVARAAVSAGLAPSQVLQAYAHGFAANLVSAAVRLVPLGQSEAVRALRALEPDIADVTGRADGSSLDDLGSAALLSEIAAMRHETLVVRLFRT